MKIEKGDRITLSYHGTLRQMVVDRTFLAASTGNKCITGKLLNDKDGKEFKTFIVSKIDDEGTVYVTGKAKV